MRRVVVLNPKGGSGKTTIAVNLAAWYARRGDRPVLMDYDPQASATAWLRRRPERLPRIHLIDAATRDNRVTRAFQLRIPENAGVVVVDTPAAIDPAEISEFTAGADRILVPVLPSPIDIQACTRCVQTLLLVAKVKRAHNRLGIIANRVRARTRVAQSLDTFLGTLGIPIVATLRDSQNYIHCAAEGLGIHDVPEPQARDDLDTWRPLEYWLQSDDAPLALAAGAGEALLT